MKKLRVVLVDDEIMIREVLRRYHEMPVQYAEYVADLLSFERILSSSMLFDKKYEVLYLHSFDGFFQLVVLQPSARPPKLFNRD